MVLILVIIIPTDVIGGFVPCQVFNNGDGTFMVEYVPSIVGEWPLQK